MKKMFVLIFLIISSSLLCSVSIYNGKIDREKIEIQILSDNNTIYHLIYHSNKNKHPMIFEKKDAQIFEYKEENNEFSKIIQFNDKVLSEKLEINYIEKNKKKNEKKISLKLGGTYEIFNDNPDNSSFENVEIFQKETLKEVYFSIIISKETFKKIKIDKIYIYNKKNGKKKEEIDVSLYNIRFNGMHSIKISDFNFDGIDEFFLTNENYKTSSLFFDLGGINGLFYILDKNKNEYKLLDFSDGKVSFDSNKKTIESIKYFSEEDGDGFFAPYGKIVVKRYNVVNGDFIKEEDSINFYDRINDKYIKTLDGRAPEPLRQLHVPKIGIYIGKIGDEEVEFQFHFKDEGKVHGIYNKKGNIIPIILESIEYGNNPVFYHYNENKEHINTLVFKHLDFKKEEIFGVMTDIKSNKDQEICINLKKAYEKKEDYNDGMSFYQKSVINDYFFKIKVDSTKRVLLVSDVEIYSKKTNEEKIPDFFIQTSLSDYTRIRGSSYMRYLVEDEGKEITESYYNLSFRNSREGEYVLFEERKTIVTKNSKEIIITNPQINKGIPKSTIYKMENDEFIQEGKYEIVYDEINGEDIKVQEKKRPEPLIKRYIPKIAQYKGNVRGIALEMHVQYKNENNHEIMFQYGLDTVPIYLVEKDKNIYHHYDEEEKHVATVTFRDFSIDNISILGEYINHQSNVKHGISLYQSAKMSPPKSNITKMMYLFQKSSSKDIFFKVAVFNGMSGNLRGYPVVSVVKGYSKKTGEEIYHIFLGDKYNALRFLGLDSIKLIDDYETGEIPAFFIKTSLKDYTKEESDYERIEIHEKGKKIKRVIYEKVGEEYI